MRKKLFAIVMSMTMVASFMPSIAFATTTYSVSNSDCWSYVLGEKTAKLVKVVKDVDGTKSDLAYDVDATVSYLKEDGTTNAWVCGDTVTVGKIKFETKKNVAELGAPAVWVDDTDTVVTFPEHDYTVVPAKAATCTEDGNYEYKVCKTCGSYTVKKETATTNGTGGAAAAKAAATIAKKEHNVTLPTNSSYWLHPANDQVNLSVLAELTCDDCGKTFVIDHASNAEASQGFLASAANVTTDATLAETAKDCTVAGAVTGKSAKVEVAPTKATIKGTSTRPTVDVNVHYVAKETAAANPDHNFGTTSKFDWNDDHTKCVYKYNKCNNCGVYEKEIDCKVTKDASASFSSGTTTYTATCQVTPESAPVTDTVNVTGNKAPHDIVAVPAKAATCTANGYKAYYECANCKAVFKKTTDGRYVPATKTVVPKSHSWVGSYTLPTKTQLATQFFGAGHSITSTVNVTDVVCSKCGVGGADINNCAITVNGTEYAKLNEGKNACVDSIVLPLEIAGTAISENVTLDARKHNSVSAGAAPKFIWNTEDPANATCEAAFYYCNNHDVVCKNPEADEAYVFVDANDVCGSSTVAQPATVEKTVKVEPTCTKTGEATYTASYKHSQTGKIYTETKKVVLPKAAHKTEVIPAVAATVFAKGKTAGVKCSVCGEVLTAPEEVDTLKVGTAKISSLKAGKKSFTVKASAANATGYRVYYKKAGAKKYSYTTVKAKNLSKTVKKLSKGKKYTVKVKAYAKNYDGDGQVVWGALSSGKTVKVK